MRMRSQERGYGRSGETVLGVNVATARLALKVAPHDDVSRWLRGSLLLSATIAVGAVLAARIVNAAINSYTGGQRSSQARQLNQDIAMLADRINQVRADVLRTDRLPPGAQEVRQFGATWLSVGGGQTGSVAVGLLGALGWCF